MDIVRYLLKRGKNMKHIAIYIKGICYNLEEMKPGKYIEVLE